MQYSRNKNKESSISKSKVKNVLKRVSRRTFLINTAIAGTALTLPAKSYARLLGANERIRIGFIGAGGMGNNHLNACKKLKEKNNLDFLGVDDCCQSRAVAGAALR